ncbi:MAG: hypothetical protein RL685_6163, partial [Pseudomonadota bacterium]
AALRGVSGYDLKQWIARWQAELRTKELATARSQQMTMGNELVRVRVGDLLMYNQHFDAAARHFTQALGRVPQASALRYRASQAELSAGRPVEAEARLGKLDDLDGPHAGWFALRGRFDAEAGNAQAAADSSTMALSLDPWSELVACEGHQSNLLGSDPWQLPDPPDPLRQKLCATARARPPIQ